jgi:hypothetical protein
LRAGGFPEVPGDGVLYRGLVGEVGEVGEYGGIAGRFPGLFIVVII